MGGKPYRVVAITDRAGGYDYPSEVTFEIRQNVIRDYARAAEYLNGSSAQIVSLQHEFGIYGGDAGKYLSVLLSPSEKACNHDCAHDFGKSSQRITGKPLRTS